MVGPAVQQTRHTVTGIVKDETGEPIIGANVSVKGSATGAVTDLDEKFSLTVPANATLKVTCIGYAEKEVKVGA